MEQIGRIQIERELGHGGMGVVYKGYDPFLQRPVAVKSVLISMIATHHMAGLVKRLEVEARASARLSHPNIVAVYDIIPESGSFYVVMEYVEGQNLDVAAPEGSRPALPFISDVIRQCAAGLDHAHSRGVVHRDIKPSNILLDVSGAVKIADFGIAKLIDSNAELTQGHAIGTMSYMSPEQMTGQAVDGHADQYSLAVVAYRLLTGSRQRTMPASVLNPMLRRGVDAVLDRALAMSPGDRYSSCSTFAQDLADALTVSESGLEARTVVVPAARPFEKTTAPGLSPTPSLPNQPPVSPQGTPRLEPWTADSTKTLRQGTGKAWMIGVLATVALSVGLYLALPLIRPSDNHVLSENMAAQETWEAIKGSQNAEDFERFSKAFPESELARGAEIQAAALRRDAKPASEPARPEPAAKSIPKQVAPLKQEIVPAKLPNSADLWTQIKYSRNPEDFDQFVKTYPKSEFAAEATMRAQQLRQIVVHGKASNGLVRQKGTGRILTDAHWMLSAGELAPVPIRSGVLPQFTPEGRHATQQGVVVLSLMVDETGQAQNVRVYRSLDPALDQKSIATVERWHFDPGTKDGKPVRISGNIEFFFQP